jgi:putative addiction module component (TIGR02574 family)
MSATEILAAAKALPLDERIEIAQGLWEDIAGNGYDADLTPEQIAELERRAAEARAHPEQGIPWERLREELFARYGVKQ